MKCVALALALASCVHTKTPNTFVSAEHTECLAWCPVFTLTLYADGAVKYQGRHNVPRGTKWRKIDSQQVRRLMDWAERIPDWECDPKRFTNDLPGVVITVSRHGQITRRFTRNDGDPCAPRAAIDLDGDISLTGGAAYFIAK